MTNGVNGAPMGNYRLPKAEAAKSGDVQNARPAVKSPPSAILKSMPAPVETARSEMRGIVRDIAAQPPVDVSKVERLSQMVDAGSYKIDIGRLADAMIASERSR